MILHGTDTLAYTSSALSFMLENLGKPVSVTMMMIIMMMIVMMMMQVIVTGSQIPAFETRSDGRDNLVGALIMAGNFSIPEVTVYFNHKLLRGNRTVKVTAEIIVTFDIICYCPLGERGVPARLREPQHRPAGHGGHLHPGQYPSIYLQSTPL